MRAGVQGIGVTVLTLLTCSALAAVPLKLPIQGVVRDNAGAPVAEDVFSARFALYDTPDAILPIWVEHWPPEGVECALLPNACLVVQGGAFQVELGHYTPLDTSIFATGDSLWLGLAVETDPELPRRPLGSSPYAIHAQSAASLACSGCVSEDMLSLETREALRDQAVEAVQTLGYVDASGALVAVEAAGYVKADGAVAAVEASGYVKADGAVAAAEEAGYVKADGALVAVEEAGYVKADGALVAVEEAGYVKAEGAVAAVEAGDLNVAGTVQVFGGVVVGPGPLPCDEAHAGALQFDPTTQRLAFCTGTELLQLRGCTTECEAPSSVACSEPLFTGCGDPCDGAGSGLNAVQCLSAVNTTPCGVEVVDVCGNTCEQVGNALEPTQCPAPESVACGEVVTDACGNACGGTGLALVESLCGDPAQTPCGQPTTDTCGNDCGVPGTGLSLGTCPPTDSVTCGVDIADACGNPCGTLGSECPAGQGCASDVGCVQVGETADFPGLNCKDIKDQVASSEDGQYWIDPDGTGGQEPFQVFCDMAIDGGGWTLYTKWSHGEEHALHTPGDDKGSCAYEDAYSDFDSECGLPEVWTRFSPSEMRYVMQDAEVGRGDFDFDYKRDAGSFIVGTGNWMPNGTITSLLDNCGSDSGKPPTTDSCDGCGAWCTDKSSPGSAGNWDVKACNARKDANCNRWGAGGPGVNRPATSMLFVR